MYVIVILNTNLLTLHSQEDFSIFLLAKVMGIHRKIGTK